MSSDKGALIAAVGQAVKAFQDATDAFDEAAAAWLGLNRTDLRCLGVIAERGPVSVGEVGKAIGLTRGATTTALDRVEKAGYARRVRDPNDRRGVLLELTEKAEREAGAIWNPMVEQANQGLVLGFTEDELKTVLRFLTEATAHQYRHLAKKP